MTIPVWVLLGYAGWTLLLLVSTIGVYRWSAILRRRANLFDFPADQPHGKEWYRRAMRAHANCIENLPIYTAIVFVITVAHLESTLLNVLAIVLLCARILQSLTHVIFTQTNLVVAYRFTFFAIQLVCMISMAIYVCIA